MNGFENISIEQIRNVMATRARGIIGQAPQVKTSVLVPVVKDSHGEISVLFTKRALTLRRQPGEISFPGGHQEDSDATDADTALRETREELGITSADIEYVGPLDVLVAWSGLIVHPHVGILRDLSALHPNPDEVAEVFTVPITTLLQTTPDVYDVALQPTPPADFPYDLIENGRAYKWRTTNVRQYFYHCGGHVIWGLTARILTHFLDVMRQSGNTK